jgi:3-oxoacyl-[acyl-carrier protein] reductase
MDLQLIGKRVLVTGSNSGIGAAVVKRLAGEGARVVVHGRDAARAQGVADEISALGQEAHIATGDLGTDEGAAEVAEKVRAAVGDIDILVNNAGGSEDPSLTWANTEWEHWLSDFETNTGSAFRMIKQFLPAMKEQGWGRIVQVTSASAIMPFAHTTPSYNSIKVGLITMTVSLSKTVARHGITVNCITPGPVDSAVFRKFVTNLPNFEQMPFEEIEKIMAKKWNVPVGRLGRPEDLASAITFLSSPLASFITGTNIRIDGGMCGFINA